MSDLNSYPFGAPCESPISKLTHGKGRRVYSGPPKAHTRPYTSLSFLPFRCGHVRGIPLPERLLTKCPPLFGGRAFRRQDEARLCMPQGYPARWDLGSRP